MPSLARTVQPSDERGQRLLDREATLMRFGGDEPLLIEIAAVFVRTVPQLIASVGAAVAGNELKQAFHHAHSLKGAVAAFEAPEVLRAFVQLEAEAKSGDAAACAKTWPRAKELVEKLVVELAIEPGNTDQTQPGK
jgi:HPt (histidine-containing phosphotransfer) domain-containing protein